VVLAEPKALSRADGQEYEKYIAASFRLTRVIYFRAGGSGLKSFPICVFSLSLGLWVWVTFSYIGHHEQTQQHARLHSITSTLKLASTTLQGGAKNQALESCRQAGRAAVGQYTLIRVV
jgi:hypothetical protein